MSLSAISQDKFEREIKFGKKVFKIYKWENKRIRDFKIPKGWDFAKYQDVIDLFDNKIIDYPKEGFREYFCKHYSKRKQKEKLMSGFFLGRYSNLNSNDRNLENSDDYGRVVIVKK